jgi:hypothetical protein
MTQSLTRHESASIAVGQNPSNSVPRGQCGSDERYLGVIHDLVSEEQERRRAGTGTQINVTGMFQELDDKIPSKYLNPGRP